MVKELRYQDYQTIDSESGAIHTISYEYDRENRLIRVSDSTGAVLEYSYDGAGRRTLEKRKINDTTEQVFSYVYNGAGKVTEIRQSADEEGCGRKTSSTVYEYDHNGNLTGRMAQDPSQPERKLSETYEYTPEGLLKSAISGGMSYSYSYDPVNRLINKSASGWALLSYNCDLNGNLIC